MRVTLAAYSADKVTQRNLNQVAAYSYSPGGTVKTLVPINVGIYESYNEIVIGSSSVDFRIDTWPKGISNLTWDVSRQGGLQNLSFTLDIEEADLDLVRGDRIYVTMYGDTTQQFVGFINSFSTQMEDKTESTTVTAIGYCSYNSVTVTITGAEFWTDSEGYEVPVLRGRTVRGYLQELIDGRYEVGPDTSPADGTPDYIIDVKGLKDYSPIKALVHSIDPLDDATENVFTFDGVQWHAVVKQLIEFLNAAVGSYKYYWDIYDNAGVLTLRVGAASGETIYSVPESPYRIIKAAASESSVVSRYEDNPAARNDKITAYYVKTASERGFVYVGGTIDPEAHNEKVLNWTFTWATIAQVTPYVMNLLTLHNDTNLGSMALSNENKLLNPYTSARVRVTTTAPSYSEKLYDIGSIRYAVSVEKALEAEVTFGGASASDRGSSSLINRITMNTEVLVENIFEKLTPGEVNVSMTVGEYEYAPGGLTQGKQPTGLKHGLGTLRVTASSSSGSGTSESGTIGETIAADSERSIRRVSCDALVSGTELTYVPKSEETDPVNGDAIIAQGYWIGNITVSGVQKVTVTAEDRMGNMGVDWEYYWNSDDPMGVEWDKTGPRVSQAMSASTNRIDSMGIGSPLVVYASAEDPETGVDATSFVLQISTDGISYTEEHPMTAVGETYPGWYTVSVDIKAGPPAHAKGSLIFYRTKCLDLAGNVGYSSITEGIVDGVPPTVAVSAQSYGTETETNISDYPEVRGNLRFRITVKDASAIASIYAKPSVSDAELMIWPTGGAVKDPDNVDGNAWIYEVGASYRSKRAWTFRAVDIFGNDGQETIKVDHKSADGDGDNDKPTREQIVDGLDTETADPDIHGTHIMSGSMPSDRLLGGTNEISETVTSPVANSANLKWRDVGGFRALTYSAVDSAVPANRVPVLDITTSGDIIPVTNDSPALGISGKAWYKAWVNRLEGLWGSIDHLGTVTGNIVVGINKLLFGASYESGWAVGKKGGQLTRTRDDGASVVVEEVDPIREGYGTPAPLAQEADVLTLVPDGRGGLMPSWGEPTGGGSGFAEKIELVCGTRTYTLGIERNGITDEAFVTLIDDAGKFFLSYDTNANEFALGDSELIFRPKATGTNLVIEHESGWGIAANGTAVGIVVGFKAG